MFAYRYDNNGFFSGRCVCQLDPVKTAKTGISHFLIPANSTLTPVPDHIPENSIPIFDEISGQWSFTDDYRGMKIYRGTEAVEVDLIGPIPDGYSLNPTPEYLEMKRRMEFKVNRASVVSELTVKVNSRTYDANEEAQSRMDRAIRAAQILNSPVIPLWVLADNTVVTDIPVGELEQALAMSIVAMSEVWIDNRG